MDEVLYTKCPVNFPNFIVKDPRLNAD